MNGASYNGCIMNTAVQNLLEELRSGLKRLYGSRLKRVYLFGSHARGEATPESDVDVLIVLDRVDHYYTELKKTGSLASDLSIRYDVCISRVFISEEDWLRKKTPFLSNVREDAVPA